MIRPKVSSATFPNFSIHPPKQARVCVIVSGSGSGAGLLLPWVFGGAEWKVHFRTMFRRTFACAGPWPWRRCLHGYRDESRHCRTVSYSAVD
jgi:hypothetical protein